MKPHRLIGILIFIMFSGPLWSQSAKILYISADYRTGAEYDKIRTDISSGLRSCLQEKWTREISNTTWERSASKNGLLKSVRVNYVLKLEQLPVIKSTDKKVEVKFSLIYVDSTYTPEKKTWHNSLYVLELNDGLPTNVKKVVSKVCEEIDFYIQSSSNPSERKFRPVIKIEEIEIASGDIEDIDNNAFRKWLSKVLEDKYSVNPDYLFYFSRKYDKQYPDNSVYKITGQFVKYKEVSDNLVSLQLTIEFPDAHDVDATIIHSQEFSFDEKRKDELVNNIISVLEEDIDYYGQK